jgi:glycosyltransferase involved in cell wall biosynthesis
MLLWKNKLLILKKNQMPTKRIIVSVTNDLSNDQRVHRICTSLSNFGYEILLIGRRLKSSPPITGRTYSIQRFKLLFNKGVLFYLCFNLRLFLILLFSKSDILLSNDLDTLAANTAAAFLKRKKLVYDSHELFTEVPELSEKRNKKKAWEILEMICFPRINLAYTVCNPIAKFYKDKYKIDFGVIRNLPVRRKTKLDYSSRENILIYQGALNKDRGIEMLIKAMQYVSDCKLIIAGKGDLEVELKYFSNKLNLNDKIVFTGNLDFDILYNLTKQAKIGFSLEQGNSLNYQYALPNKIFDYIQAGVPVLCSDLPEMQKIIKENNVGFIFSGSDERELAIKINQLIQNKETLNNINQNCIIQAKVLNWENEEKILMNLFNALRD